MLDITFQGNDISLDIQEQQSHVGRRFLLQINSSTTPFDASQPVFIVLLCIIAILSILFVIIIVFLCRLLRIQHELRTPDTPSTTPEETFANRQNLSNATSPLPHSHHTYVNDISSLSLETTDVNKLNSYLFIDLHSTSSETYPDYKYRQSTNNRWTSYNYFEQEHPPPHTHQRSHAPRFLMRERSLAKNTRHLPQLRQATMEQQKNLFGLDDSDDSSRSVTTNPSSIYHLNPTFITQEHHILHNIEEEEPSSIHSQSLTDDNQLHIPYNYSFIRSNQSVYINNSFFV
ncbi:unnamed protein product [Adineta ricciae]|uniref:Uncharacterized protein n=1 Tax=Adineta ricciae TaxID=249248 RepID=A0A814XW57_ADIRI|nr:unnamed protein product [Adineta ricciae]CAF1674859.1 unnamed protein product [Adineta ricciae]